MMVGMLCISCYNIGCSRISGCFHISGCPGIPDAAARERKSTQSYSPHAITQHNNLIHSDQSFLSSSDPHPLPGADQRNPKTLTSILLIYPQLPSYSTPSNLDLLLQLSPSNPYFLLRLTPSRMLFPFIIHPGLARYVLQAQPCSGFAFLLSFISYI
jgi:hypothetical protein